MHGIILLSDNDFIVEKTTYCWSLKKWILKDVHFFNKIEIVSMKFFVEKDVNWSNLIILSVRK